MSLFFILHDWILSGQTLYIFPMFLRDKLNYGPCGFPAFLKESGLLEGPTVANKEGWGSHSNRVTSLYYVRSAYLLSVYPYQLAALDQLGSSVFPLFFSPQLHLTLNITLN